VPLHVNLGEFTHIKTQDTTFQQQSHTTTRESNGNIGHVTKHTAKDSSRRSMFRLGQGHKTQRLPTFLFKMPQCNDSAVKELYCYSTSPKLPIDEPLGSQQSIGTTL
jgi:hypothetical protein